MEPLTQRSYVNKLVTIETTTGSIHNGVVFTVDPISGSFVLCHTDADKRPSCVEVIMGNRIKRVTVKAEGSDMDAPDSAFGTCRIVSDRKETDSDPAVVTRKGDVVSWLTKHRIPVVETGSSLSIMDALIVNAPYRAEDCLSANPIVLGRVQDLIGNMPDDFHVP